VATGKLFVGNLPWKITEDALKDHFSQCGEVYSVKIIRDKETGRSKGFGFIEMNDHIKAMQELNGKVIEGRPLVINEAKPR
jgi:RNA recognition motif-containing protein